MFARRILTTTTKQTFAKPTLFYTAKRFGGDHHHHEEYDPSQGPFLFSRKVFTHLIWEFIYENFIKFIIYLWK